MSDNRPQSTRQATGYVADSSHALQGALLAFSRPAIPRAPSSSNTSSRTLNGVYYRKSPDTGQGDAQPMAPSQSVQIRPPSLAAQPAIPLARSPGAQAAVVAAARSKPVKLHARPAALHVADSNNREVDASRDVLPIPGTVEDLKGRFEHRDTATTSKSFSSSTKASATSSKSKSEETTLTLDERPKLGLDTGVALKIAARASPEIHSPKPVRRTSLVGPIEALVRKDSPVSEAGSDLAKSQSQQRPIVPPPRGAARNAAPAPISRTASLATIGHDSEDYFEIRRPASTTVRSTSGTVSSGFRTPQITKRGSLAGLNNGQVDVRRVDSLANAIVGAHLAASRAPSPAKTIDSRQTESILFPEWPTRRPPISRTPSPKKGFMKQTLREPIAPTKVEKDKVQWHRERSLFHVRKHPHKHHEGNRKRWRDEISEEERKRYEGLWAANKGIYIALTADEAQKPEVVELAKSYVSGLVVKDIWSRSRLTLHDLEEIWNLVDKEGLHRLSRENFVVGTWLIDQRLKGRKLPYKVGESVWHSVRGIYGLKVPKLKDRTHT